MILNTKSVNSKEVFKDAFEDSLPPPYNRGSLIFKCIIKYQSFVSLVKWFFNDFLQRRMRKIISIHQRRSSLCFAPSYFISNKKLRTFVNGLQVGLVTTKYVTDLFDNFSATHLDLMFFEST